MKIKLAQYIADFMVDNGIEQCFTITGGGAMHLNDAFGHKSGLRCIYNHHEQGSAIAAEGYARTCGKPALVCVTSGPGGTNALTGVMGAWLDSIPMFVVSGQVKRATTIWSTDLPLRQLGDQEYNIVDVAKEMTKYAVMITEPESIAYHLEKALYLALNGRQGPVWLDVPLDVQAAVIETDTLEHFVPEEKDKAENPVYDTSLTPEILKRLAQAKRPVVFAGEGIRMAEAVPQFLELLAKLKVPVVTAWNAHDLVADDNEFYCGRPGTVGTRGGNFVVQKSDFLLILGCRLNIRQISYNWEKFAPEAYKVMVDIDAAELHKPTLSIDRPVHANVRDVIADLLRYPVDGDVHKTWLALARSINSRYPAVLPEFYEMESPVNPYVFCYEASRQFTKDDTITTGNGSACVITFQAAAIKQGQRLFTNSGCASMGYGVPAALGASAAKPNSRTICLDGDGSIMMNLQELQTIAQNRCNIKIFILNNAGYHSIRQTQQNLFKSGPVGIGPESHDLSFPDFEKLAEAFGLAYKCLNKTSEINQVVEQTLATEGPIICEVILDPNQIFMPKLSSRVLPDGTIVSPEIDDMFPFLEREEYEAVKNS